MADFNKLINSDRPVIVDFFADWCLPSKEMDPVLKEVVSEIGDKAKVLRVNIDNNWPAVLKYKVTTVPTVIIFKRGEIWWKNTGITSANKLLDIVNLIA